MSAGIEGQLFSWTGWDELDEGDVQFTGCTLNCDIGPFKTNDHVDSIAILFSISSIQIDHNGNTFIGKLQLSVVP